jgi:hypothetical protein
MFRGAPSGANPDRRFRLSNRGTVIASMSAVPSCCFDWGSACAGRVGAGDPGSLRRLWGVSRVRSNLSAP